MAEKQYNVILEGTIVPGHSRHDVVKKLSAAFKKDAAFTDKLLDGRPRLIRQNIDFPSADKYRKIIERAGAVCRIEQVEEKGTSAAQKPQDAQVPPPAPPLATCTRCGYEATRDDDVMLVRGDCPRCGFMVTKEATAEGFHEPGEGEEDFSDTGEFQTDLFAGRMPASLSRRTLASIYTFSQFLTVYCILVLVFIVSFTPLNSVPEQVAKRFLIWAWTTYPVLLGVLSVLIVSFVAPIFNEGLSWGQKAFSIDMLYTQEVQVGGLALSLAYRTLAVCVLTFAPVLIFRWVGYKAIAWDASGADTPVVILLAVIAWSLSWLLFLMAGGKRSLLDVAGGTVQTETSLLPPKALRKALFPLFTILVILCALGALSVTLEKLKL